MIKLKLKSNNNKIGRSVNLVLNFASNVKHHIFTAACMVAWASLGALVVKDPPAKAGDIRDVGSNPESRRSPGGGHGNLHEYSCLENAMDRGAWGAIIYTGANSQIRLK